MPCILAIDLGTSSAKAALVDGAGEIIDSAQQTLSVDHPLPDWAEQPVERWWNAISSATRKLWKQGVGSPGEVEAVVFSCHMLGLVPVDAEGEALLPCLLWLDTRSREQARRMTSGFPSINGYGVWRLAQWLYFSNGAPNLAGHDPASKMVWLREERPDIWERTATLLDAKDWLVMRSTGRRLTTYDCASVGWLLDTRKGRVGWSDHLLGMAGVPRDMLPELVSSTEIAGPLLEAAASDLGLPRGIPVVAGAGDANACAVGSGAMDDAQVHLYLGTSSWMAAYLPNRAVHPLASMATVCGAEAKRYLLIAEQQTAGAALEWVRARMLPADTSFEQINAWVDEAPPGAGGAFFFPWFAGERAPVDEHEIRAGFVNLSLEHGREHLLRSVFEGVAFNSRWALDPMCRVMPRRPDRLRLIGGGAQSEPWCQIVADVFGLPVEQAHAPQFAGVRGVAMIASRALGKLDELADASRLVKVEKVFEPDAERRALYDDRFGRWREFYKNNLRWYRKLNA